MGILREETILLKDFVRFPAGAVAIFTCNNSDLQKAESRIHSYAVRANAKIELRSFIMLDPATGSTQRIIFTIITKQGDLKKSPPGRPSAAPKKCHKCNKVAVARGYCSTHYQFYRRRMLLNADPTEL